MKVFYRFVESAIIHRKRMDAHKNIINRFLLEEGRGICSKVWGNTTQVWDITSPRLLPEHNYIALIAHAYIRQMAFNNIFIFIYWIYIQSTVGFNRLGIIYSFNSNICVSGSQLSSRAIQRRVLLPFRLTTPAAITTFTINLITTTEDVDKSI